uniref:C2H2-type domain-containing protein n=1 Tax=Anopheles epiroticus TaxID=199890 RepID=A0A182PHF8_9DIPT
MAESAALVPRSNGDSFCEEESLPSIPNDMSERLLDDSVLSVCGNEYGADEGSVRDWINYDELPLLNQQKQQQQQQQLPVPTDHISGRSSSIDVRVEFERCKNCQCEKFFPSNECLQEHMELNHRMIDETLPVMTTIPRVAYAEQEGSGPSGGYIGV